jgi:hypothetical protein
VTDDEFLGLLPHGGTPIDLYYVYLDKFADTEIIGCWDANFGPWSFTPIDLNPRGVEYTAMREHLRRRGNPVFASHDDIYDHARKVDWPGAGKW